METLIILITFFTLFTLKYILSNVFSEIKKEWWISNEKLIEMMYKPSIIIPTKYIKHKLIEYKFSYKLLLTFNDEVFDIEFNKVDIKNYFMDDVIDDCKKTFSKYISYYSDGDIDFYKMMVKNVPILMLDDVVCLEKI